jgi:hypothetical protein
MKVADIWLRRKLSLVRSHKVQGLWVTLLLSAYEKGTVRRVNCDAPSELKNTGSYIPPIPNYKAKLRASKQDSQLWLLEV